MEKPLQISFDFPLTHSDRTISTTAMATLHHSEPYYIIDDFYFSGQKRSVNQLRLLPKQEIKRLKTGSSYTWVDRETERESLLTHVMGNAIDAAEGKLK